MTVNILKDGQNKISQPRIIQDIINQVNLPSNSTTIHTSEFAVNILQCDASTPPFDKLLHYPVVIKHLNFIKYIN